MAMGWAIMAAALTLRPDAPVLTLEAARVMPASNLANDMLTQDHPPIVQAIVHPTGMDAPLPWVFAVDLVQRPTFDPTDGLCRAEVATINLEPTLPQHVGNPTPSPARPVSLSFRRYGRLAAQPEPLVSCNQPIARYFPIDLQREADQLDLIRGLLDLKRQIASGGALPADTSFSDQLVDSMESVGGGHSIIPRISDARQALLAFPLEELVGVAVYRKEPDVEGELDAAGATWIATITLKGANVVKLNMVRRIPPPF